MDEILELLKTEEGRGELLALYNSQKDEVMPAILAFRDTVGVDLDKFVDEMIDWGARKTFKVYIAYQSAGFNKAEAMQLTLNLKESLNRITNKTNINKKS